MEKSPEIDLKTRNKCTLGADKHGKFEGKSKFVKICVGKACNIQINLWD